MGDENSLAGRTQAHKHELASSTGGYLSTGLTGVTNLSNGSMVYGNASEIVTELSATVDGDVLELSGGLPSWQTPAGGGVWTEIYDSGVTVGTAGITTGAFSAPNKFVKVIGYVKPSSSSVFGAIFDSDGGANYDGCTMRDQVFGANYTNERSIFLQSGVASNNFFYFDFQFYNADTTDDKLVHNVSILNPSTPQSYYSYTSWTNSTGAITEITLANANSGAVENFDAGSRLRVLATG